MKILILGKSPRDRCLAFLCQERGHTLPEQGPWDVAVLPLPKSAITDEISDKLPDGQRIVCGLTDPAFDALAEKRRWKLLRVLQDERYTQENAVLTAEGAVHAAMSQSDRALAGQQALVLGYGRIGIALTKMLRGLGVQVTVAARRSESRREAGPNSIPMEAIPSILPQTTLVFSSVPSPLLTEKELQLLPPAARLLELASPPYGIDLDAAKRLHLNCSLESGLPGRYCPRSAAETLLRYIEREDEHHE